jgi:hypothetical protein
MLLMQKNIFLILVLFIFIACGNKNGSSNQDPGYGPVNLAPLLQLPDEYSPAGLSDKVFESNGDTHAPMDIIQQRLVMTFDPVNQTVKGHSVIKFRVKKTGRPYFELQSTVNHVTLDSVSTSATSIKDPDGQNQNYLSIDLEVTPDNLHEVEFDYQLPSGRVSFADGGVKFLTDMTDLNGKFFEYWGPVGFEGDAFVMDLELKVENSTSAHALYTNGKVLSATADAWNISFPQYYSKSSFYIHLTNLTGLTSKKIVYQGLTKEIPVEVYGANATLVSSAVAQLPKLFKELEGDYGAYPHEKFIAYMNERSGGMEYVGATITSLGSLDHELLHSWFGRSVIPADGRSGWIDEAIASWRDYGYTKATTLLGRTPTNLANYSPYRKSTPTNSYVDGRGLLSELDLKFAKIGGLKPIMKAFFERYKNKIMTNEEFWQYLETQTTFDLSAFSVRYAIGEAEETPQDPSEPVDSKHPTPLTEEEILSLR